MTACPCQSGKTYINCCGPIINGDRVADTAETLMRSRYTAFATGAIDYLRESLHPDYRADYDHKATQRWSEQSEWTGLEIKLTEDGEGGAKEGTVEFIARYKQNGQRLSHHERAAFISVDGRWYYTDGKIVAPQTLRHESPKTGRNAPCPCGSGKKYKKCCLVT